MFKKLSLLLAAVMLFTSMGIASPVSAQAATEENVLVESNFQNCNLGTYSAENQLNGETDLRNGIIMFLVSAIFGTTTNRKNAPN